MSDAIFVGIPPHGDVCRVLHAVITPDGVILGKLMKMSDLKQIEARLIELIQAIDDLRRSLEVRHEQTPISSGVSWNEYEQYG